MTTLPTGWYRDPSSHLGHRYWDGEQWFGYSVAGALEPVRPVWSAAA